MQWTRNVCTERAVPGQRGEGREAHLAGAQAAQRVELRLQLAQRQAAGGGRAAHDGGQRARYQLLLILREQPLRDQCHSYTLYNAGGPRGRGGGGANYPVSVRKGQKRHAISRYVIDITWYEIIIWHHFTPNILLEIRIDLR